MSKEDEPGDLRLLNGKTGSLMAACRILLVIIVASIFPILKAEGQSIPELSQKSGDGLSSSDILSRVQATYRDINDLSADFVQQSYIQGFDAKNFKGRLYLKKPGLARWDYTKPVKQNIVINGDHVTLYFHEQKQAIIQKASAHPDAEPALGLLSNIERWEEDYIVYGEDSGGSILRLRLTPKTMLLVREVTVEIDKKTYHINKLTLLENSVNRVSFSFSGMKFNSGLKDGLFDFQIPRGTEVMEY